MTKRRQKSDLTSDEALLLDNQVCFPLYSAANAVSRAYRPILDQLELTYSQYLVMMVLWEQDGASVKEVGARLYLDSGTLTPLLKRLESKGFVARSRSEEDERVRVLNLTAEGRRLQKVANSVPSAMKCKIDLSIDELMSLKHLCEKVVKKLA
ncbi:MarR family winged helix-turn-helix transcriptional regulator [Vibrio ostreicida]|uniref:MarR family transcriptional regulator n=1 Tax=Vibrio ostreicida TaxID=526588 RepID=A0ABT8BV88_9VIBR|nr:MarR family transcriptional regulator [Vibrio ostreicida]MDN3610304.1 MarR family transcriptional regulator [Vibrio ostreicida]NPD07682.1 MarR family transcriptional regulator [Vibrio ostreicida]